MIEREIKDSLMHFAGQYPVTLVTGPRQSGKTTLVKTAYPDLAYVSLEDLDTRQFAQNDPRRFLAQFDSGAVLDEVQRVPNLTSYIQTMVDEKFFQQPVILTGSGQFEMMDQMSQSLAGRTALLKLLPFTLSEAYIDLKIVPVDEILVSGFYPRIFDQKLDPNAFYSFYTSTYLERDVQSLIKVKDFTIFEKFLKLCAGRTGQILNLSALGNEVGVAHNTIREWLSVLEASFLIFFLRPFSKNINKRIVKSPKLYFTDVGLAAYLMGIENARQVATHPLRGALFETFIIGEFLKFRFNTGKGNNLYYYRDSSGTEVDLVMEYGPDIVAIEIKSAETISQNFFKPLSRFEKYFGTLKKKIVLYAGNALQQRSEGTIYNFRDLAHLFNFLNQL
jgi:predicted AAA+ superfamily ATPase